ncbi:FAD-dependent monooxygenase [Verrucomicrobium spinosum]|uniref:FAD-dependent monooxygenase n=1 Tax=Verrucomicrobium spinosum TaxID=2736 RepID=UPI0009464707|nr:FAD-dependent monooxygenase [Verrucomicrobium spinosum]
MRRWVVQTEAAVTDADATALMEIVQQRTGICVSPSGVTATSSFSPRWMQSETYGDGRVFLCGDAAHVMSPLAVRA